MTDLIQALHDAGAEAEAKIPWLNSGGCAVFADVVVQELRRLAVPAWGRVAMRSPGRNTITRVRKLLREESVDTKTATCEPWNDQGIDFTHVLAGFRHNGKTYLCDSSGTMAGRVRRENTCGAPLLPGRMSPKELHAIAADEWGWNDMFDRAHIPTVQAIVKRHLAKVQL